MSLQRLGPVLVTVGVALVLAGLLAGSGRLAWFGRLPGDIRVERDGLRVFVPITSMLLVSLALSVLLHLARRWFR